MMKALRWHGRGDIRTEEIAIPHPAAGEALIHIEWCGICGSDLHEYTDGPMGIPQPGCKHPLSGEGSPITLGHEFCGHIVTAPEDSGLLKDQGVMVDPRYWCDACDACSLGKTNVCKTFGFYGLSGRSGGFSEYVTIPVRNLIPIPDSAPLHLAALIEPLAVAWHSVIRSEAKPDADAFALVLGGGPIGLAVMLVLKMQCWRNVIVSEPSAVRRAKAQQHAKFVVDPISENVPEKVQVLTHGRGVDVVFDCAGIQKGMDTGCASLRPGGVYQNLAGWTTAWNPNQVDMTCKELVFKSSMSYTHEDMVEVTKHFIEGKFGDLEDLVTRRIHLDEVKDKGFDELLRSKDKQIKILVTPNRKLLATS